jgi:hypothetical protein
VTSLFVLDIPENTTLIQLVESDAALAVDRVGPYRRIASADAIVIDRRASGCRHAVWYSAVAGLGRGARIAQHDKDALRVEVVQ